MKNRLIPYLGVVICLFIFSLNIHAQDDARVLLQDLEEEDIKNIDALAMYPKETRTAVLQACLHPETIIKIKKIQEKTSRDFSNLMEEYPQETQQEVWDLTRYPNLIQRLVNNGEPDSRTMKTILKDYPTVIHSRAKTCVKKYFPILKKINTLEEISQTAFERIIEPYDEPTQAALQKLVTLPEVMTVLTENIEVTLLVGDAYRNYPEWVVQQADSLHLELARQNTKELEDWKKRIEENPDLEEELQASAENFAKENNFDDLYYEADDYTEYTDDLYYQEEEQPQQVVIEKHYYNHYPYWYGYPRWYAYPRWRPYPYWFDWGFHFRPGRNIVVINMPSFYFVDWYFYHPNHHHHSPHLSAHFVDHYYGHRRSTGSITSSVRTWREQNKAVVSDDMVVNAPRRIQAYKELGKMEQARSKYNQKNPKSTLTQKQFVEKNKRSYPKLEKEVRRNKEFTSKGKPQITPKKQDTKRRYQFPDRTKATPKKRKEVPKTPKVIPKKRKEVRKIPRVIPKRSNKKAREWHQKTWERSKRKTRPRPRIKINANNRKPKILKPKNLKLPTKKRSGRN